MQSFTYSDAGLAMTKAFEGFREAAYKDAAGVWTIGYGHTGADVAAGRRVTMLEAEVLLRADLRAAVQCVNEAVTTSITQAQFDALVDFCYNAGRGNFRSSSLLNYVNAREFATVGVQFGLWIHAGGAVQAGLVRRRKAEADMFCGKLVNRAA